MTPHSVTTGDGGPATARADIGAYAQLPPGVDGSDAARVVPVQAGLRFLTR